MEKVKENNRYKYCIDCQNCMVFNTIETDKQNEVMHVPSHHSNQAGACIRDATSVSETKIVYYRCKIINGPCVEYIAHCSDKVKKSK